MATNLSTLVGGRVPDYIEFGWVCAPNGAAQSITANTVTTLSCDTLVANTGGLSITAPVNNQFTIPAGTYQYEILVRWQGSAQQGLIVGLRNVTDNIIVGAMNGSKHYEGLPLSFSGMLKIENNKTFDIYGIAESTDTYIRNGIYTVQSTNTTAGYDQRTAVKLWKLK